MVYDSLVNVSAQTSRLGVEPFQQSSPAVWHEWNEPPDTPPDPMLDAVRIVLMIPPAYQVIDHLILDLNYSQ